jgi:protein phosphatase
MLEAIGQTDAGKVRTSNQDAFRIFPDLGLYLLADGMGGARGGERASRLAVDSVADALRRVPHRDASALTSAVEEANAKVFAEATADPRLEGMGTTLVAVLETGPAELAVVSVGDSRAYLFQGLKLRAVTEDQTWVQEVGRPLGLDEEILRTHPMRHVLTMAVGVGAALRYRYYSVELLGDELMLLSSDGLHGVVSIADIERILGASGTSLDEKCGQLIAAAHAKGSPDNVTVVLLCRSA